MHASRINPRPAHRLARVFPALLLLLAGTAALPGARAEAPASWGAAATRGDDSTLKIAEAFIAMINDGSEAAVKAFESKYRSPKSQAAMPVSERVKRIASMKEEFGELTIEHVDSVDEHGVSLVAKASRGPVVAMDFMFDAKSGGKLEGVSLAVGGEDVRPRALTPESRASTIEAACKALEAGYVFPEVAARMTAKVREKAKKGGYDSVKMEGALAKTLTDDFRSVSNDRHLRVNVSPEPEGGSHGQGHGGPDGEEEMSRGNYAFKKVEILPGNIGYVRFDMFVEHEGANRAASAAMAFVQNADAIIFDMRHNGGGSPECIRYITSYLFDSKTHLNDMVDRDGKIVEEYWTLPEVPGNRIKASVPVYVLTSGYTFSGAEEFTYNLKNLKRATVVGETTGGGAHPVRGERLNERFMMGVPFMRAQNPISKTNWEGDGIEPDIKTTADDALDRAVEEAKKAIAAARGAKGG